jgi:hypothetical protein
MLLGESLALATSIGMTMALSIAAYRRLRSARVDVDVERLVEVFR